MSFNIMHDSGLPLCFVGLGRMSQDLYSFFKTEKNNIIISYEDIILQNKEWFKTYQFIVITADISKKIAVVELLKLHKAHFFSLVHSSSYVCFDTKIGHGTIIMPFNCFSVRGIVIGNHVDIHTHNTFGHECVVDNYCHIGHHSFLNKCHIHQGTVLGTRIDIMAGGIDEYIHIAEFCNILSHSIITESLPDTGTYYKSKKINNQSSLQYRIC